MKLQTNIKVNNSLLLDARVKVPPKARPKLAERFEKKESIDD